ncbi:MAG TPA: DUF2279 domain-containing protein [Cytophagaceae bacterium]
MKRLFLLLLIIHLSMEVLAYQGLGTTKNDSSTINKKKLALIIGSETAFYLGGMSYLQFIWYKDHQNVPFHFYNDTKGYLQVDKFGHCFGAYIESYIGYYWLRSAGVSKKKALIFGGPLGLVLQTPIEIFDGIYEGYGFSMSDMVANTIGSALVVGQELAFNDQIIKYKFSFTRSEYAKQSNGYLGSNNLESLFLDYNGHTYWLSLNANKLFLKSRLPAWFNIAAGYSANGMFGEFENRRYYRGQWLPETERYRQFLLSLDVDWTRINTNSKFLNVVFKSMFFIKLPFPALEVNSQGKVKGYWLYF